MLGPKHMKVVVYTAVFNDYDILWGPKVRSEGVRFVCFSDRPIVRTDGWDVVQVDAPNGHLFSQRFYKLCSHLAFPEADVTLYLDGTFELLVDPLQLVDRYLSKSDVALFRHPQRQGVFEELDACARLGKDDPHLLEMIAELYASEGMPASGYLHAGGFILRRHSQQVAAFNESWYGELVRSGIRDQPALARALWKSGISFETIDGNIWRNDMMNYHPHKAKLLPEHRRFLFLGGNPPSGAAALCELLNNDPRIVLGMERYSKIRERITPEDFSDQRFFAPTEEETSYLPTRLIPPDQAGFRVWPEDEASMKEKWTSEALVYIGDTSPFYVWQLPYLRETFPGARFIVMIRDPMSGADSYQRRAEDVEDHWRSGNDFKLALEHGNQSAENLLVYLERFGFNDVFIVDYDTFYGGDRDYLLSLYRFLGLEIAPEVKHQFEVVTAEWGSRRNQLLRLGFAMEDEVSARSSWEAYSQIRRVLPIMRDYRLLALQRGAWIDSEERLSSEVEANRRLRDLSRFLYLTVRALLQDEAIGNPTDIQRAQRAEAAWRSFWNSADSAEKRAEGPGGA